MKARFFALNLVVLLGLMIACGASAPATAPTSEATTTQGRFVHEGHPENYLQLRSDGTFYREEGGDAFSGTYKIYEENEMIFTLPSGAASKVTINGQVLTDPDGVRWVKSNSVASSAQDKRAIDCTQQLPDDSSLRLSNSSSANAAVQVVWTLRFGLDDARVDALEADSYGNVYIAYRGNLRKFDPCGNELWTRPVNTRASLAIDQGGNIYLIGEKRSGTKGKPGTPVLKKYDSSGAELWARETTSVGSLEIDERGNVDIILGNEIIQYDSSGAELGTLRSPSLVDTIARSAPNKAGDVSTLTASAEISRTRRNVTHGLAQ